MLSYYGQEFEPRPKLQNLVKDIRHFVAPIVNSLAKFGKHLSIDKVHDIMTHEKQKSIFNFLTDFFMSLTFKIPKIFLAKVGKI